VILIGLRVPEEELLGAHPWHAVGAHTFIPVATVVERAADEFEVPWPALTDQLPGFLIDIPSPCVVTRCDVHHIIVIHVDIIVAVLSK